MNFIIVYNNENIKENYLNNLCDVMKKLKQNYEIIEFKSVYKLKNCKMDYLIVLGGDGMVIKCAKIVNKIPIFSINIGHLGFLTTEKSSISFEEAIKYLIEKNYLIEKRLMFNVSLFRNGKKLYNNLALNEVFITSSVLGIMGKYKIYIDNEKNLFNEFNSDGIIVSTPTGSTAYSFSVGGPIVAPDVSCIIFTPINSHAFCKASFIINDKLKVIVDILVNNQSIKVDGRDSFELKKGDKIIIKKTIKYANLIRNNNYDFLETVKSKIKKI